VSLNYIIKIYFLRFGKSSLTRLQGEYIMTEVRINLESKILNKIIKELEGIKNELKKSNASRDKRYKEWMTMKKKWKKNHSK
jgi:hypothetical protein